MMWLLFVGAFVLAGAGCLWAAHRALSLYDAEVRHPLVVFLALTAVWAVSNVLLLVPVSPPVMHASYIVGLVFGFPTVIVWLWFCSAYAGTPYHYDRRLQALAVGATGAVVLVKLTNPLHELYFQPAVASVPFTHFAPETGLLYWLVTAIAYAGSAVGLYLLFDLYASSRFKTTSVAVLTVLIALPVVPKLLAVVRPETLALVFYEPLGAAAFGIGVVTVARDTFLSVRAPARRQLANRLSDIVIVVDQRGRIAEYNESAEAIFDGLRDTLGEPLTAAVPQLMDHEGDGELLEIPSESGPQFFTVRTPEIRLGRTTVGRAFVLSDVTELETQRRQLKQQTEHLEGLTEEVAHQLRNPLTILKGELNWVKDRQPSTTADDGNGSSGSIDAAVEAAERIERIAEDLLSVIAYGKPVSGVEPISLTDLIERAASEDGGDGITVTVACGDAVSIRGEQIRCRELFRLLFRAHSERGATEISVERTGDRLAISSDGAPFSVENPEELFNYGIETDDDVRMLLANARTLARVHGWSISTELDSETPTIVLEGVAFSSVEE